jgi:hypothetical protein
VEEFVEEFRDCREEFVDRRDEFVDDDAHAPFLPLSLP